MSINNFKKNKFIIIVAGPTAVGKTQTSIDLAKHYQADIFSADSRQVYVEMDIGTAKPSADELTEIKHHFIDSVSIHEDYSVGHYYQDITKAFKLYFENNDIAIVTGGTGLYLKAIMEGLDNFPDVPKKIYDYFQEQFTTYGLEWLQNQVKISDPIYYEVVDKYNPRRLMRALAVIEVSGRPFSTFFLEKKKDILPYRVIEVLLELPREVLFERINQRVDIMIERGLEIEARSLYSCKNLRALQTVGYQEFFQYFDSLITFEEAKALIKQNSRRYAKRQMTWFRKYGDWKVFNTTDYIQIVNYIDERINFLKIP